MPAAIGPRLRLLREKAKLSLAKVGDGLRAAVDVDLDVSTLSRMERGQRTIPADLLPAWLSVLGASDADTLGVVRAA